MDELVRLRIEPKSVLEVGCANGWRVERLIERYNCKAKGIDPALPEFKRPSLNNLRHGHAAALYHYPSVHFDLVIYGFCLYLCDPQDYPAIVNEGDRVLADGGYLVIHDFDMEKGEAPWRTPYKHKEGIFSYHVNFAALWMALPQYREMNWTKIGYESVTVLRKDLAGAFGERPNP